MTARRPEVAVGAVAVVTEHLLLVQRANAPEAGRWTVPGGRVEPGERMVDAVVREVGEETAMKVRCNRLLGVAERIGPDHHFVILDFLVDLVGDGPGCALPEPIAGGDATAAVWVALAQAESVDLVSGLGRFLRRCGVLPDRPSPRQTSRSADRAC